MDQLFHDGAARVSWVEREVLAMYASKKRKIIKIVMQSLTKTKQGWHPCFHLQPRTYGRKPGEKNDASLYWKQTKVLTFLVQLIMAALWINGTCTDVFVQ